MTGSARTRNVTYSTSRPSSLSKTSSAIVAVAACSASPFIAASSRHMAACRQATSPFRCQEKCVRMNRAASPTVRIKWRLDSRSLAVRTRLSSTVLMMMSRVAIVSLQTTFRPATILSHHQSAGGALCRCQGRWLTLSGTEETSVVRETSPNSVARSSSCCKMRWALAKDLRGWGDGLPHRARTGRGPVPAIHAQALDGSPIGEVPFSHQDAGTRYTRKCKVHRRHRGLIFKRGLMTWQ